MALQFGHRGQESPDEAVLDADVAIAARDLGLERNPGFEHAVRLGRDFALGDPPIARLHSLAANGHQVRDMLTHCLKQVKPRDWRVAEGEIATEADGVLESWISFETEIARGYGLIRIKDGLIWTLLTTMAELKGHEEKAGFTRAARREARRQSRRQDLEGIAGRGGGEARLRNAALCADHRRRAGRDRAWRAPAGNSACRRSSRRRTSAPAIPGASATSRSACTIRSGTTICPISTSRRIGRCSRRRTRSATGWKCTPR